MPCGAGKRRGRVTFVITQAFVCPGGQQHLDERRKSTMRRLVQWRVTALLGGIDICTPGEECPNHV